MNLPQSKTPRTDAVVFTARHVTLCADSDGEEIALHLSLDPRLHRCVTAAFARELELEIADLRARLAAANEMLERAGNASPLDFS